MIAAIRAVSTAAVAAALLVGATGQALAQLPPEPPAPPTDLGPIHIVVYSDDPGHGATLCAIAVGQAPLGSTCDVEPRSAAPDNRTWIWTGEAV